MKRRRTATVVKLGLVVVVLAVGAWLAMRDVDFAAQANRCVRFFREAGPTAFFTAMALLPVVGFPLSPFTLAAGPVICTLAMGPSSSTSSSPPPPVPTR